MLINGSNFTSCKTATADARTIVITSENRPALLITHLFLITAQR